MVFRESETVELKSIVVEDIKKEIIAFANCEGGKLYIGVQDDGTVVGLDDPDGVALQISNMVRDAIKPDVTMFLRYKTIEEQGKKLVVVDIQQGTERPYYIAKKGLRPEGVYVRQGYSSVPATNTMIRRMIKETDGDHFEDLRSLEQNLTFQAAKKVFFTQFTPQRSREKNYFFFRRRRLNSSRKRSISSLLSKGMSGRMSFSPFSGVFSGRMSAVSDKSSSPISLMFL